MACTRAHFITAEEFDAITSTLRYDEEAIFWRDLPVGVIYRVDQLYFAKTKSGKRFALVLTPN